MAVTSLITARDLDLSDLRKVFVKQRLPQSERFRTYFGRATDMARLESSIRQADYGYMVNLCDLESEVLSLDPHLSGILGKRFGLVKSLDWELEPPTGPDVDVEMAEEIAAKVNQDLLHLPNFSERIYDLLWGLYDGRAAQEIMWQMTGGKYRFRPSELRWIHPRRLSFGPRREIRIVNPMSTPGNFAIDGVAVDEVPGKFLWWKPRIFREYPEREGIAPRTLYWSFFKRYSWRYRMILTELFGVPWRIIEQDEASQGYSIEDAELALEKLGQESTAVLDPGMKLRVEPPHPESGGLFEMTNDQVDAQMSKLVLWQTGTTDAVANRAESVVHKSEEDVLRIMDAAGVSERITERLVLPDVQLNFGTDNLINAPKFVIRAEPPRDQKAEQERADKAIMVGVPVSVKQYREITGLREPEEDEPFIVPKDGGTIIVTPVQEGSDEGSDDASVSVATVITITPSDVATIVTVDEARASQGLGSMLLPDGSPDPDGQLTIAEFQAKNAAQIAKANAATSGQVGPGAAPDATPPALPQGDPDPDPLAIPEGDIEDAKDAAEEDLVAAVMAKGLTKDAARLAIRICREGKDFGSLSAIPGLGSDDAYWLSSIVPPLCVVSLEKQRNAYSVGIVDLQNHGHVLTIPAAHFEAVDGPRQYDVKGQADHGHAMLLTADQLEALGAGTEVKAEVAPGGESAHTHTVTMARPELAQMSQPFGTFESIGDCVTTIRAADPSVSVESATTIARSLLAAEETRTMECMSRLLAASAADEE